MTRSSSILGALVACLTLAGGVANAQETNPVLRHPANDAAEARVLVKFREAGPPGRAQAQAATDRVAALATRTGIQFRSSRALGAKWHVVELDPTVSTAEQLVRILADDTVETATLDQRRYPHALPNDPFYTGQWYLQTNATNSAAINAEQAWNTATGSNGVVIADIDTGIRYEHPDLGRAQDGGRVLPGYDFITDARIANDGDGRDADPTDTGDFLSSTEAATDFFKDCGGTSNSSWHGTRTAGIIGARTNNSEGIAGTTWSPWIVPVRVLGKCGGFDTDIVPAMLWAAGIHVDGVPDNPYPAQIENLSLGASGLCGQLYADAIAAVSAVGVVVVVSAGNEGGPVDAPANCPGAVGVAGLRHIGTKVGFSSLGPEIALSAPGGNCVNTNGGPCLFPINTTSNSGTNGPGASIYTDQLNPSVGTSFSAPIVSGIAGLMLGVNGNLGAAQIRARLREGAVLPFPVNNDPAANPPVLQCHVPTGSTDLQPVECNCTTSTCGAGIANAPGAVLAALRPIAAVTTPGSVSAGQNVSLSAAGSAAACGRTIVSYTWTGTGLTTPPNQAAATFVAPTSGSITATVTVTDDAGKQDSADVVLTSSTATTTAPSNAGTNACRTAVVPPLPVNVTVDPLTVTLLAAASQTFTATVTNTTNTVVNWSVNGVVGGSSTTGTITTAGVFTAPASVAAAMVVTVTATSAADSSKTASATVTVNPIPAPTVVPQSSGGGGGGAFGLLDLVGLAALGLLRRRRGPQS